MKTKSIFISLVVICALFLSSCDYERIRVSSDVTTREVRYSDYSGLKLSNAFNAFITFSDTDERIEIEANDNLHDRIVVKKEGPDLIVRLKRHTNIKGKATLNVYITTRRITNFDISGASNLTLENELVVKNASIALSGASEFYGKMNLERLQLDLSGASELNVFGETERLNASISGSSELRDYDFIVDRLDIRLSGASDTYVTVNETIDIRASGASELNYKGDAIVNNRDLSGASEINKRD